MRIKFSWTVNGVCHNCSHEDRFDIEEVPDDITDEELEQMAQDYFYNDIEPEWWWEKIDDSKT